jgi:protein-S-isoprenylcysteine O-methyltransferase Ste14
MYGRIVRVMALRISRPLNWVIQAGLFPALLVGAPLSLSAMGKRHGWSAERPGAANVAGVLPLSAGAGLLVWAMASHNRAAPRGWEVGLTPGYLLTRGPYRCSRNPIYVGEAAIWAGWALLFGSLPVATGLAALVVVQRGIVRIEERMLQTRWGVSYDDYQRQVPRWIGLPAVYGCPDRSQTARSDGRDCSSANCQDRLIRTQFGMSG